MQPDILLIPIGSVPADLLSWLEGRLAEATDRKVAGGKPIPPPADGYNARRRQYRGDILLDALQATAVGTDRVLGIIDADCYMPGLNFIFGQAAVGGRHALIALPRLRPGPGNRDAELKLFYERALTEAVHELGHTWGLEHCPDKKCVMFFSNSLRDTDEKGAGFCAKCRGELSPTLLPRSL